MHFYPERLQQVRAALKITKAEAARRLNISAMAYGRYEKENANLLISLCATLPRPFIVIRIIYMAFQMK